jgi:hypothetical protein
VINKRSTAMFLPLLSHINQAGGGRALTLPGAQGLARMAVGGVSAPLIREQLRTGTSEPIDYNQLAQALQGVNLSVSVRDTEQAAKRKAFTDRMANF